MTKTRLFNIFLVVAIFVAAAGIWTATRPSHASQASTSTVTADNGTVLASVSASGTVQSAQQQNVNFSTAGTLTEVDVKVGDHVTAGQVLAKIDPTNAQNSLSVAQAQLTAAQEALAQAQSNAASPTTTAPTTPTTTTGHSSGDSSAVQPQLDRDKAALAPLQQTLTAARKSFDSATAALNDSLAFQQKCLANPATPPHGSVTCATVGTQVQIDSAAQRSAQAQVDSAGVAVNTQLAVIAADEGALSATSGSGAATGSASGAGSSQSYASNGGGSGGSSGVGSGAGSGSVAQLQATVTQDQINVDNAQKNLDGTTLTAPSDGTVASVSAAVGQTISGSGTSSASSSSASSGGGTGSSGGGGTGGSSGSGSASSSSTGSAGSSSGGFVVLTDLTSFQVQAGFAEGDATKLTLNQKAIVTFAALPNVQVQGEVTQIAPTATTVNNVVTYQATIGLDQNPTQLRPGMSATAQVVVGEADNVLKVPTSAVSGTGTTGRVTVVGADGSQTPTQVSVGLRGDTDVQIISGLGKGDQVQRSAVSTTGSGGSSPTGGGGNPRGGGGFGGGGIGGGGIGGRG